MDKLNKALILDKLNKALNFTRTSVTPMSYMSNTLVCQKKVKSHTSKTYFNKLYLYGFLFFLAYECVLLV